MIAVRLLCLWLGCTGLRWLIALPITEPLGWTAIDLGHRETDLFGLVSQGWVTVLKSSRQGFGSAVSATTLQGVCEIP